MGLPRHRAPRDVPEDEPLAEPVSAERLGPIWEEAPALPLALGPRARTSPARRQPPGHRPGSPDAYDGDAWTGLPAHTARRLGLLSVADACATADPRIAAFEVMPAELDAGDRRHGIGIGLPDELLGIAAPCRREGTQYTVPRRNRPSRRRTRERRPAALTPARRPASAATAPVARPFSLPCDIASLLHAAPSRTPAHRHAIGVRGHWCRLSGSHLPRSVRADREKGGDAIGGSWLLRLRRESSRACRRARVRV